MPGAARRGQQGLGSWLPPLTSLSQSAATPTCLEDRLDSAELKIQATRERKSVSIFPEVNVS